MVLESGNPILLIFVILGFDDKEDKKTSIWKCYEAWGLAGQNVKVAFTCCFPPLFLLLPTSKDANIRTVGMCTGKSKPKDWCPDPIVVHST